MNDSWQEAIEWLELYSQLREQLLEILSAKDLEYTLPGDNPSFGELCRQMGEVQQSYLDSFQTFEQNFDYRHKEASVERDPEALAAWYKRLDGAMFIRLMNMPEEKVAHQLIDRGHDFQVDLKTQLNIYREALIIFYGKASVYMKAMGKELPGRWSHWIG